MIHEDPTRPGVMLVDMDPWLVEQLSTDWGLPCQHRILEDSLTLRAMRPVVCHGIGIGAVHYVIDEEPGELTVLEKAIRALRPADVERVVRGGRIIG